MADAAGTNRVSDSGARQRPSHGPSEHGLTRPGNRPLEHPAEAGYTAAMPCPACDRLERARAGRDPDFVAALPEASVFLADEQVYRGYCLVITNEHMEQLDQVPIECQVRLWEDVARVASGYVYHVSL